MHPTEWAFKKIYTHGQETCSRHLFHFELDVFRYSIKMPSRSAEADTKTEAIKKEKKVLSIFFLFP